VLDGKGVLIINLGLGTLVKRNYKHHLSALILIYNESTKICLNPELKNKNHTETD
jgi:hypothetical protein